MRRILAAAGALSLTVLALTACSTVEDGAAASCTNDVPGSTALDLVRIDGDEVGTLPEVVVTAPVHVDDVSATQLIAGDGPRVTTATQPLILDLALVDGDTGAALTATPFGRAAAQVTTLAGWEQTLPGLTDALECAAPGSRHVIAMPAAGLPAEIVSGAQLDEDGTLVVIADVSQVYLAAADGAEQFNDRPGMPSVVRAPGGRPGVVLPQADPPAEQVVELLKKGDGETVDAAATALVHYTGVLWPGGTVTESTWDTAPQAVTSADPVAFAAALEGQTVGSQLLVVAPGAALQGESGAPAQVYVVDILGIAPTA